MGMFIRAMIKPQVWLPARTMRLSSSYAIIEYCLSSAEGDASRMLKVPPGFRQEQLPAGWRLVQTAHKWYYGLRIMDEQAQIEGGEEPACTSS